MPTLTKDKRTFFFLHIPKCGGSSVVDTFTNCGFSTELSVRGKPPSEFFTASPQHQVFSNIKSLLNIENIDSIFTVVRNPYNRIKSEYNWEFRDTPISERIDFSHWVIDSISNAASNKSYRDNHFRPMVEFFDLDHPTHIFKLEDGLDMLFELYAQDIYSHNSIQVLHQKNFKTLKHYNTFFSLNNDAHNVINEFYSSDFEAFDYEMIETTSDFELEKVKDNSTSNLINTLHLWREETLFIIKNDFMKKIQILDDQLDTLGKHNENYETLSSKSLDRAINANKYAYDIIPLRLTFLKEKLLKVYENNYSHINSLNCLLNDYRKILISPT